MIPRDISKNILEDWTSKKAIVLLGPRQVGKTTLIQKLTENKKFSCNWLEVIYIRIF